MDDGWLLVPLLTWGCHRLLHLFRLPAPITPCWSFPMATRIPMF